MSLEILKLHSNDSYFEESAYCKRRFFLRFIAVSLTVLFAAGCASRHVSHPSVKSEKHVSRMGYTIQVGAFSKAENAARLTDLLHDQGLDATYFVASAGLYKVRFGNYPSKSAALEKAESLKSIEVIDEYYIVSPEEYAVAKSQKYGRQYLREEIVKSARSFVGVPYLWGGSSSAAGFDCSGLAMTVYQLNGLDLPRSSHEQYEAGDPVKHDHLLKGDLVFFRMSGGDKVSHVGVYTGDGQFIHAPGRGKAICVDSLSKSYFRKRYAGGRSYL
jgi:cell wall-associated NlpC family hydrolase